MEFGVDASLPIYSGGLGVLAGDHLKAAADLGVPLVGVGLFYRGGYFVQGLSDEGRQTEDVQRVDPEALGLVREPVSVEVDLAGETVTRSRLALRRRLDTRCRSTCSTSTSLTDALYSGDREHRIRQELLLGVGGVRALAALGLAADRLPRQRRPLGVPDDRARARSSSRAACDDGARARARPRARRSSRRTRRCRPATRSSATSSSLRYVGDLAARAGLSHDELLALGRATGTDGFGLTPLALRLSAAANGVSELHGEVAREMWAALWPGEEPPIDAITNGVHLGTWLAPELAELLRTAGRAARGAARRGQLARRARPRPGRALGRARRRSRRRLAELTGFDADAADDRLRAPLRDVQARRPRLLATSSVCSRCRVQIVVAGKAHPQDAPGKDVMQRIVELSRDPARRGPRRLPRGLRHRPRAARSSRAATSG